MALIVKTTGEVDIVDDKLSLEALQELVGGYIEHVGVNVIVGGTKYIHLIVNEEGKLDGLAFNEFATAALLTAGFDDYICGNAVFMKAGEFV